MRTFVERIDMRETHKDMGVVTKVVSVHNGVVVDARIRNVEYNIAIHGPGMNHACRGDIRI